MTFGELKQSLSYLLAGDSAMRKDPGAIAVFYKKAVEDIARGTEPLSLITSDHERFKALRPVDSVYFIRKPEVPQDDDDRLDIDEALIDAVLNLIASYIVRNSPDQQRKKLFEQAAAEIMDEYIAESLNYLESTGFYRIPYAKESYCPTTERTDIPARLDISGLLKYYRVEPSTGSRRGWRYTWDSPTAEKLDKFMLTGAVALSQSEKALWDQLCKWADGAADPEESALKELDKTYLKRCTK